MSTQLDVIRALSTSGGVWEYPDKGLAGINFDSQSYTLLNDLTTFGVGAIGGPYAIEISTADLRARIAAKSAGTPYVPPFVDVQSYAGQDETIYVQKLLDANPNATTEQLDSIRKYAMWKNVSLVGFPRLAPAGTVAIAVTAGVIPNPVAPPPPASVPLRDTPVALVNTTTGVSAPVVVPAGVMPPPSTSQVVLSVPAVTGISLSLPAVAGIVPSSSGNNPSLISPLPIIPLVNSAPVVPVKSAGIPWAWILAALAVGALVL